MQSDEEIVRLSNYNFTLDIDTLLNGSTTTRLSRLSRRAGWVPRPQNAYILYRRDKVARAEFANLKLAKISKILSQMWAAESIEVKEVFYALQRLAERRHSEMYSNRNNGNNRTSRLSRFIRL